MSTNRLSYGILIGLFVILACYSVFTVISNGASGEKASEQKNEIDRTFVYYLTTIHESLERDAEDPSSYRMLIASVGAAAGLSHLATYERENDGLDLMLASLQAAVVNDEHTEQVKYSYGQLRELFAKLVANPSDVDVTAKIGAICDRINAGGN
ncbi:hypothetical protein [Paenibacillus kobensis]|uniref:hypothetical protein n=1 Tax=Paenibacillus kobensis TaxID=59841 RepID=UPI000FDC30CD|nr:hypothetical protein [Paenibacillus kobensis]